MNRPNISVIIVNYNAEQDLKNCLSSLIPCINFKEDEIWVVDNNSTDNSLHVLAQQFPQVKTINQSFNSGYASAINQGLKQVKNPYILISNTDIIFQEGTLSYLVSTLENNPRVGMIAPELRGGNNELIQMTWEWDVTLFGEWMRKKYSPKKIKRSKSIQKQIKKFQKEEKAVPIVTGAVFLTRLNIMQKINGMDENFELYFEDSDLCKRIRNENYQILFTPKVTVQHLLGNSTNQRNIKIPLIYRQSQIYYYKKHLGHIQNTGLKLYLWAKYLLSIRFWFDKEYRTWVNRVIMKPKKIKLTDQL